MKLEGFTLQNCGAPHDKFKILGWCASFHTKEDVVGVITSRSKYFDNEIQRMISKLDIGGMILLNIEAINHSYKRIILKDIVITIN